jgi:hypothetical protein
MQLYDWAYPTVHAMPAAYQSMRSCRSISEWKSGNCLNSAPAFALLVIVERRRANIPEKTSSQLTSQSRPARMSACTANGRPNAAGRHSLSTTTRISYSRRAGSETPTVRRSSVLRSDARVDSQRRRRASSGCAETGAKVDEG